MEMAVEGNAGGMDGIDRNMLCDAEKRGASK